MDDISTIIRTFLPKKQKIERLVPVIVREPKMPKEEKPHSLGSGTSPCLLQDENIKGRYIALKSANGRQVVAVGFTRTLTYKRAMRKGYNSCIVVSNH